MEYLPLTKEEETIGKAIVNAAFKIHTALAPAYLRRFMKYAWLMNLLKTAFMCLAR